MTCKDRIELSQEERDPDWVLVDAVERPDRMSGDDQLFPTPLAVDYT